MTQASSLVIKEPAYVQVTLPYMCVTVTTAARGIWILSSTYLVCRLRSMELQARVGFSFP
jgi:hypothetical protein